MKPELEKLQSKLKMMEISFEQINNSRNDLLKQLGEQEMLNEKILLIIERLRKFFNADNVLTKSEYKQKILIEGATIVD